MSDLHEDDFAWDIEQRLPTKTVDVEASGGVDVAHAQRDDVDSGFHDVDPRNPGAPRLEQSRQASYLERPLGGPFACWWQHRAPRDKTIRILPDNSADFVVTSSGSSWLVGPPRTAELSILHTGEEIRGLRIAPGFVGCVTGVPAHELTDQHIDIADLLGTTRAARLIQQIWAGAIDRTALADLWPEQPPRAQPLVAALITRPSTTSTALAADLGYSDRQLRRLVLEHAGLTPKTLQKVARLQRFVHAVEHRSATLAEAAFGCGYSDQSHLTRDVRQLTGLPPAQLLRERRTRAIAS